MSIQTKISLFFTTVVMTAGYLSMAADPVAFLSDVQGEISFEKNGKLKKIESSCEAVCPDDILVAGKDGHGKIVYDSAIFDLLPNTKYKVGDSGISKFSGTAVVEEQPLEQGARGRLESPDMTKEVTVSMPKMLVATIIPGITRAAGDIPVYSPKNQIYSQNPLLLLGGTNDTVYEVTLLVNDEPTGKTIKVTAQHGIPFTSFEAGTMKEDEMYALKVQKDGKTVNNVGSSGFYLMEQTERVQLKQQIANLPKFSSEKAKLFFTANLYYRNECYAEAREIAKKLSDAEPNNKIYANLLKMSEKALGY